MGNFPNKSGENSRTIFQGRVQSVTGLPSLYMIPQTPVIQIPCDNDDGNPVFSGAESEIYIYKGGVLQTGWVVEEVTTSNMSATINTGVEPNTVTVSAISADIGYIDLKATKANESNQYCRLMVVRAKAGVKGDTGDTGSKGDTGDTGPAGTGNVAIIEKTITVDSYLYNNCQNANNGGSLRIIYPEAHGLSEDDYVHVFYTAVYDDVVQVISVDSANQITVDLSYEAAVSGNYITVFDPQKLARVDNTDNQFLVFDDIITTDRRILEMHLHCTDDDNKTGEIRWSSGLFIYPSTGYNSYLDSVRIDRDYDIGSCDLRAELPSIILTNDEQELWLYIDNISTENWLSDYLNLEFKLVVAYIDYS